MQNNKFSIGKLYLFSALIMLLLGLCFGILGGIVYVRPDFLKESLGFASLRPLHVSSVLFWILLGATGAVYCSLQSLGAGLLKPGLAKIQWVLWLIAIAGIYYSYFTARFGGREYWEFTPIWALPIVLAWVLFVWNVLSALRKIKNWPVYMWMWLTGSVFFFFIFIENYLWLFPYFREHFVSDMTIQWKVNGSIVGAWNQLLYGALFYLMDRISGNTATGRSKLAFFMFFLGLFNLMFNWGHHIYTLPTQAYVKYVGYAVSMTEWLFLIKIIYNWRSTVSATQKYVHYFPYRFVMASDLWVFINLLQALMMSIPAINIYTHGTHVTVAHAMGTTIGINSMILLALCFEFLWAAGQKAKTRLLNFAFWTLQISLFIFWLSLLLAGIKKGLWQMSEDQGVYSKMMESLQPYFISFLVAGCGLFIALVILIGFLFKVPGLRTNSST
jgi:nitric oxide reductase subunit B